jgi:hypothetical protein
MECYLTLHQIVAAKVSQYYWGSEQFDFASPRLKSDKTFMLKAVVWSPVMFIKAFDELQKDFDMVVASLACSLRFDNAPPWLANSLKSK